MGQPDSVNQLPDHVRFLIPKFDDVKKLLVPHNNTLTLGHRLPLSNEVQRVILNFKLMFWNKMKYNTSVRKLKIMTKFQY